MNKEQIKEQIESIFNTPKAWEMVKNIYGNVTVDEQILKVDYIIDQIVTLTQQHEANALKEQMERVMGVIDRQINSYKDNNPLWINKVTVLEDIKDNLKSQLESE